MRSTRKQPFCWQEKKINRLLRKSYFGAERVKMILLYATITEIDSDFNGKNIKYYSKTISTYSGLSVKWIPKALKKLEELNIIKLIVSRVEGRLAEREIEFTPDNVEKVVLKTDGRKPTNRKTTSRETPTLEDSSYKEDISLEEDMATSVAKEIPLVIELFKTVNPSVELLYGNKTQRSACERLLKKWNINQIKAVVSILPELNADRYAKGKSITPYELEKNLGFIEAWIKSKNNNKLKIAKISKEDWEAME